MPFAPAALELLLPNGVARYVALLTAAPDIAAGTYVQYGDRQACTVWEAVTGGRANGDEIAWPVLLEDVVFAWWALFDAAVAGNMLAAGPLLNGFDDPELQQAIAGDAPGFQAYGLTITFEG